MPEIEEMEAAIRVAREFCDNYLIQVEGLNTDRIWGFIRETEKKLELAKTELISSPDFTLQKVEVLLKTDQQFTQKWLQVLSDEGLIQDNHRKFLGDMVDTLLGRGSYFHKTYQKNIPRKVGRDLTPGQWGATSRILIEHYTEVIFRLLKRPAPEDMKRLVEEALAKNDFEALLKLSRGGK